MVYYFKIICCEVSAMWKQKIGISVYNSYSIPTPEVVKLLKTIGFDAVSPEIEENVDLAPIVEAARECGMELQSLHAPYYKAADLWSHDPEVFTPALQEMFDAVDLCVRFSVPTLVMHVWIGFQYTFDSANLCFDNYDKLVEYAAKQGITLAMENTEGDEFLFTLMDRYRDNPHVGFCWDSGHEQCYNHSQDMLAHFGDRLVITHLNDNLGISRFDGNTFWTDDLHLLPYDGVVDWEDAINRLRKAKKLDILNFELNIHSKPNRHENDCYTQMELTQYFTECYKRACRIAFRYAK